jgi:ATP-dependent Clp protease adaptor protein ClpS
MSQAAATAEVLPATRKRRRTAERPKPRHQPRYSVVLWNDDDHTYAYVVAMMMELFGYTREKGYQIAKAVDTEGRAVVITTTKEHAELKRDQIHAYGKDKSVAQCKGSMWATIEPAEEQG